MILIGAMAEILGEYTEAVSKVLEQLMMTNALPFPRRMRVWMLRCLPFTTVLPPLPTPPHALRIVTRTR
ncbi:Glycine--tRNA ligase beta subunit [Rhynchospora pubera]|uniref:Glycine--tRNA ligase beta subunit n=1 Tax=Rhynchospora pubera TaxID=906938 RepID=A0AAV8GSH1_9POAL|nr:Glycine--tRNA ligase beta subunit [Rhynchospora pubera]KAJ4785451.1 Glycine--tRNA ligase beta subunit [Rhynchospora pubera]KAJ4805715.1 Glycine--tRNA ligase beta subunit [Rhynchospora pubera]KAJ4805803.1 Glycine--tRNA ligase beta subunit [Rhynchospora pubera]